MIPPRRSGPAALSFRSHIKTSRVPFVSFAAQLQPWLSKTINWPLELMPPGMTRLMPAPAAADRVATERETSSVVRPRRSCKKMFRTPA